MPSPTPTWGGIFLPVMGVQLLKKAGFPNKNVCIASSTFLINPDRPRLDDLKYF